MERGMRKENGVPPDPSTDLSTCVTRVTSSTHERRDYERVRANVSACVRACFALFSLIVDFCFKRTFSRRKTNNKIIFDRTRKAVILTTQFNL